MAEFCMPSLGADMDEGTLLEWLVAPGDRVHRGDIVAVVDTEKSDIEVEVFEDGVVGELLVDVGATVPVGTPLARIESAAGGTSPPPAADRHVAVSEGPARRLPTTARGAGRVLSPLVRQLAAELRVDTHELAGSGPGGVVTRHDVERAAAEPAAVAPPPSRPSRSAAGTGPGRVRSSPYARRLARERVVDLATLVGSGPGGAVLALDVPAAAVVPVHDRETALAAAEHPELNGWWEDGHRPSSAVHLGVAIALRGGGLVAPRIADADGLTVTELMARLRDLTARARAGRVRQQEWVGQTITVTNLGDLGVDAVWGVIHPPQLAMVGFGAVHDAVVVAEGRPVVRPVVVASLAADHRASDGIQGAAFLGRIAHLLQDPDPLDRTTPPTEGPRP